MKAALIVARICAEHPSAAAFNQQLALLAEKREQVTSWLNAESKRIIGSVSKEYRYEVRSCVNELYLPAEVREAGAFRVVRVWLNKSTFVNHAKKYGVGVGQDNPESVCSHVYYRTDNVLVTWVGSGSALLKSNQSCSDIEWQLIQQGMVPGKFLVAA